MTENPDGELRPNFRPWSYREPANNVTLHVNSQGPDGIAFVAVPQREATEPRDQYGVVVPRPLARDLVNALRAHLDDSELRYNPATGSLVIPAGWRSRAGDIPADHLDALQIGAMDLADGIRVGYRVGWLAKAGHEVTVDDAGRVQIGALAERPSGLPEHLRGDGPCQGCGTPDNIMWTTESALWNRVLGGPGMRDDPGGILCIPCFVKLADVAGVGRMWRLDHYRSDADRAPDPHTVAVLDAAIVWRQNLGDLEAIDLSTEEQDLLAAVDAMLAARHDLRDQPAAASEAEFLAAIDHHNDQARRLSLPPLSPPVTPAADFADEAAHERVARALHAEVYPDPGARKAAWSDAGSRQAAYTLARAAIDAYRAGPTGESVPGGGTADEWRNLAALASADASKYFNQVADLAEALSRRGIKHRLNAASRALTLARTEVQRQHAAGYAEAVRRLRDDDAYRNWWTARDDAAPDSEAYWKAGPRNHLADYLESTAPAIRREGLMRGRWLKPVGQDTVDLAEAVDAADPDATPTDGGADGR